MTYSTYTFVKSECAGISRSNETNFIFLIDPDLRIRIVIMLILT